MNKVDDWENQWHDGVPLARIAAGAGVSRQRVHGALRRRLGPKALAEGRVEYARRRAVTATAARRETMGAMTDATIDGMNACTSWAAIYATAGFRFDNDDQIAAWGRLRVAPSRRPATARRVGGVDRGEAISQLAEFFGENPTGDRVAWKRWAARNGAYGRAPTMVACGRRWEDLRAFVVDGTPLPPSPKCLSCDDALDAVRTYLMTGDDTARGYAAWRRQADAPTITSVYVAAGVSSWAAVVAAAQQHR